MTCLIFWSSCRNDFETTASTGNLGFSEDTIYLDTIFTNIGSSTRNMKVYNKSDEDILIPSVRLAQGESSNYRLNIDGLPGKVFENIPILANDSIFVFIETTIDIDNFPNPNFEFLYTDQIQFDTGNNQQDVELVTLVQDAVFLFPQRFDDGTTEEIILGLDVDGIPVAIEGFYLEDSELTFTSDKPYVIYGFAGVNTGKTLNIEPGARIHFHENSGILVEQGGSLKANGAFSLDSDIMENEIIFEGDRLEPSFSDIPGQWAAIWLRGGSTNNEFSYATIKNSGVGILMEGNDGDETLTLNNVQIYNSANVGLLARNGNVRGDNVVINNSGQTSLSCSLGGTYNFNHSTFANYWNSGFRQFPSVQIDNFQQTGETTFDVYPLIEANFNNCIIYGNEQRELILFENTDEIFNVSFNNTLIKFEDPNGDFDDIPKYPTLNPELYMNTIFNIDPAFFDIENNDFAIETDVSGADGIGSTGIADLVPLDLVGTNRGEVDNPDAGAYESTEFPEND